MPHADRRSRPVRWPAWLALAVVAWHLLGWTFDLDFIRRPLPPFIGLYPWTAVLLAGTAATQLALGRPGVRKTFALLLGPAVGLLTVFFLLEDFSFPSATPFDRLLFADDLSKLGGYAPGRPSFQICATVLSYALAAALAARSGDRRGSGFTLVALFGLFFPLWAFLGTCLYVILPHPAGSSTLMGMSLPTAVCLACMGWALLGKVAGRRARRWFRWRGSPGLVVRGILPVTVIGPAAVAGIAHFLAVRGRLNPPLGIALVLLVTVGGVALVLRVGAALQLHERRVVLAASHREQLIRKLEASQAKVEEMRRDMVFVCAWTRQVRDGNEWLSLEQFLERHFQVRVSHGISPAALTVGEEGFRSA